MGFLDKVKDTTKQLGEKAQQGVKAGQDKIEETKAKRHISDLKEQLGGIVFAQRTGNPPENADAEIARLVDEISAAEHQAAAAEAETSAPAPEAPAPASAAEEAPTA